MLDFGNVEVQGGYEQKYLTPGVEVVKVTEVKAGKSAAKGSPYVEITVANNAGLTTSTQFYLNEGQAFTISANTFFKYIAVVNGLNMNVDADKAKVKQMIGNVPDNDALAAKLSTLLVGKPFAMVIKGEWVNPSDSSKKSWVKAVLSNIVAPADKANTITYDASKHIKGTDASTVTGGPAVIASSPTASW